MAEALRIRDGNTGQEPDGDVSVRIGPTRISVRLKFRWEMALKLTAIVMLGILAGVLIAQNSSDVQVLIMMLTGLTTLLIRLIHSRGGDAAPPNAVT